MFLRFLCLLCLIGHISAQNIPSGATFVKTKYAFAADKGLISQSASDCVNKAEIVNNMKESQSMETLIELIERLEEVIANTTDQTLKMFNSADKVARLILTRFNLVNVDFNTMDQLPDYISNIDTQIVGRMFESDYYFPDNIYKKEEVCSLLFMFSHYFLNNTEPRNRIYKRGVFNFSNNATPVASSFKASLSNNDFLNQIQEKGIVSYRQDNNEAIAPANVLKGIIAGLNQNFKLSGNDILISLGKKPEITDSTISDPILAVTLGSMAGSAYFFISNPNLDDNSVFGVNGNWANSTCCSYYALGSNQFKNVKSLQFSNRGSLAEIRGALDGYIIGSNLKKMQTEAKKLKLSQILSNFYTKPHKRTGSNDFPTYCDRGSSMPTSTDLKSVTDSYGFIYRYYSDSESFTLKSDSFKSKLDEAARTQDYCNTNRPTGTLDSNTPCENPSDLIFVVDPKQEQINRTISIISAITSKINTIGRNSGSVSVFVSSNSQNNVELPSSITSWPLPALTFNRTSIGDVMCHLDFGNGYSPLTSLGKLYHGLNQTLSNLKYGPNTRSFNVLPSKNVIIIDYDTLQIPTSGSDKDEYNDYKWDLENLNIDALISVISNNEKNFADILKLKNDRISISSSDRQIADDLSKRICQNPAPFTYTPCHVKSSSNMVHVDYVTPGYLTNRAFFPQYFSKSFEIVFKVKAEDGNIKICYDREFPTTTQDRCKDLNAGSEYEIKIYNPCENQNEHTCSPIYFSIWGKDKSSGICTDQRCRSFDQIKYTVTHTGMSCNSALKVFSSFIMQLFCLIFFLVTYRKFV